jgi:transposase
MGPSICSSEHNELSGGFNAIPSRLQRPEDDSAATTQTRCSMNEKPMRRKFTDEFKNNAVQLVLDNGYSCTEVARRLNVNHTNVARWVRESRDQSDVAAESNTQRDLEAEVKKLRKENQRLLMERDILKKAAAFFANESK